MDSGVNGLTSVAPYNLPVLSKTVSSLLKPLPFERNQEATSSQTDQIALSGIKIPVLKSDNILQIIKANNSKISADAKKRQLGNGSHINSLISSTFSADVVVQSEDGDAPESNSMEIDTDIEAKHFLDIQSFIPSNLQQQLTTLIIKGFPTVKKSAIERILTLITPSNFKWSIISFEIIERRLVFIRFDSIDILHIFMTRLSELRKKLEGLEMFIDPKVEEYILKENLDLGIDVAKDEDAENEKLGVEITSIIQNPRNQEKASSTGSGTEDLEAVMSYFNSYKVEDAELVDVPNDMKSGIVKDIIKFRSKVLKIEKERRKKEIEQERQKAKSKLKKLFLDIQSNEKAGDVDMDEVDDEDENVHGNNDEYSKLLDAEYDEMMEKKWRKDQDTLYEKELKAMKDLEKYKKTVLEQKLVNLKEYENNLVENKIKYIDEFKNFDDFNPQQSGNISTKLYYSNHPEYLRNRTKEKEREEKLDLLDEADEKEDEEKNTQANHQSSIATSNAATSATTATTSIPLANRPANAPSSTTAELDNGSTATSISISSFPISTQDSIKEKISNLIEEYLGLKEESLIKFVYDHLLEHNLSQRQSLTEELAETLDDDAQVVIEELWLFIAEKHS